MGYIGHTASSRSPIPSSCGPGVSHITPLLFQQNSHIRHVFRSLTERFQVTHRRLPAWSTINSCTDIFHGSVVSHRQYKSGVSKLYVSLIKSEQNKKRKGGGGKHQGSSLHPFMIVIQLFSLHGEGSCQNIYL